MVAANVLSRAQRVFTHVFFSMLVMLIALTTGCQFRTPAKETPKVQNNGEMRSKAFFFKNQVFKPADSGNAFCSDQKFIANWEPIDERGYFAEKYTLRGVPGTMHLNVYWCFTESALIAYEINPSFEMRLGHDKKVIEIPITRHYHLEAARDNYQRPTNKTVKNEDRDAWMYQPMMDLDLAGIRVNSWSFGIIFNDPIVSDVSAVEWDDKNQFLAFTVDASDRHVGAEAQSRFRFNFKAFETNPKFKKVPYADTTSKHINVLHVIGRTIEGTHNEAYAGHWDVTNGPIEFSTFGVPDKYMDVIAKALEEWNEAFVKAGVVAPGQKALTLNTTPLKYPMDLRHPVINWVSDRRESLGSPLGIGMTSADVTNGQFLHGSVTIWGGILEEYLNKYSSAQSAYGAFAGAQDINANLPGGQNIFRESLIEENALTQQFSNSKFGLSKAPSIESFASSSEGYEKLRATLTKLGEKQQWMAEQAIKANPDLAKDPARLQQALQALQAEAKSAANSIDPSLYQSYLAQDLLESARGDSLNSMLAVFHQQFSNTLFDAPQSVQKEVRQSSMNSKQIQELSLKVANSEILARAQSQIFDLDRTFAKMIPDMVAAISQGNKTPEEVIRTTLKNLIMHEIGHVLGLGHNFKGNILPEKGTVDEKDYLELKGQLDRRGFIMSSVMDYYSPRTDVAMAYEDVKAGPYDILMLKYLYKGVYPGMRQDGSGLVEDLPVPENGEIPLVNKVNAAEGTQVVYKPAFLPACNDVEASTNVDPYCSRFDRGHNATSIMSARFEDFNSNLISLMNAFSDAKGGNAYGREGYLWYRSLQEFSQIRTFYDFMRLKLDTDPRYVDAFARIKRDADALLVFSDACLNPNLATSKARQRDFAILALKDPAKIDLGINSLIADDFTEIRDLCYANRLALEQFADLLKRKGSDYTKFDRTNRFVPSGLRGGDLDTDWGFIWGQYKEIGSFPIRLSSVLTVTSPYAYFLWGGIHGVPLFANNQSLYSYAPLYPREYGSIISTTVKENMNLGGGVLEEDTEMGTTLMYLNYFMARNRWLTKDNDNRFPQTYLDNLNTLTNFEISMSPIILNNVNKTTAPDYLVFGYQASYLDFAKWETVPIPYAYLLPNRRVVAQGNSKQIFLPVTRFRYLTDRMGYVWALDLRYHHEQQNPLKGYSVKLELDSMAQKELEKCAGGISGLSQFFNVNHPDFKGFEVGNGIAVKSDLQDRFDKSVNEAFDTYHATNFGSDGGGEKSLPRLDACDDSIRSLNVIVGGAALINGYWVPQAAQYINR